MITTNDQQNAPKAEPARLNQVTSAIIPEAAPRPEPKPWDPSKMITTHDEPKVAPEAADADEPKPEKSSKVKKRS